MYVAVATLVESTSLSVLDQQRTRLEDTLRLNVQEPFPARVQQTVKALEENPAFQANQTIHDVVKQYQGSLPPEARETIVRSGADFQDIRISDGNAGTHATLPGNLLSSANTQQLKKVFSDLTSNPTFLQDIGKKARNAATVGWYAKRAQKGEALPEDTKKSALNDISKALDQPVEALQSRLNNLSPLKNIFNVFRGAERKEVKAQIAAAQSLRDRFTDANKSDDSSLGQLLQEVKNKYGNEPAFKEAFNQYDQADKDGKELHYLQIEASQTAQDQAVRDMNNASHACDTPSLAPEKLTEMKALYETAQDLQDEGKAMEYSPRNDAVLLATSGVER